MEEVEVRKWLSTDETAKEFFSSRPPLLLPPLHRLPLRPGNVLEIVGPSPCAKTHILLEVVINCILPKHCGGLQQSVLFIDLDCRFDILRLQHLLKLRISSVINLDELFQNCLDRFFYVRCYDSFEFLASLKTLNHQLRKESQEFEFASKLCFIMIDSIGAYYWVDRASTSLPLGAISRKIFSLQSVIEAVVREIQNLLQVQPMIVLATKSTIFGDKPHNDLKRTFRKWSSHDRPDECSTARSSEGVLHREYMPSAWQSFVTHRISVRPSSPVLYANNCNTTSEQVYIAQWLLPSLGFQDKFVVKDAGILTVP